MLSSYLGYGFEGYLIAQVLKALNEASLKNYSATKTPRHELNLRVLMSLWQNSK
jgi:hypothetical protein